MFPDRRPTRPMGMGIRPPRQQNGNGRHPSRRMPEPRGGMANGRFKTTGPASNPTPRRQGGLFGGRNKNRDVPIQDTPKTKSKSSIVQQLKTDDGQWDLDKIMAVSNHVQKMYGQVSPIFTRFKSK